MNDTNLSLKNDENQIYDQIKEILLIARAKAYSAVNFAMVEAYWHIGKRIVDAQSGNEQAEYGAQLLKYLSKQLTRDFGKGFEESNLRLIRQFYLAFQIRDAVRHELSWSHYRKIMKVQSNLARNFHIDECIKSNWSTRQLERQIHTHFYERLLPIGIILCVDKSEAIVRYTLAEDNKQIFTSKYMLYLPTEQEFKNEIYTAMDENKNLKSL
jgi:predicted nuclease of restriction endonuclease-like (RecB) superfamily